MPLGCGAARVFLLSLHRVQVVSYLLRLLLQRHVGHVVDRIQRARWIRIEPREQCR